MTGYITQNITINNVELEILIDPNGIKWYPFSRFLSKVLKKEDVAKDFIGTLVEKDMRFFPFNTISPKVQNIWYINEDRLKWLLKTIEVDPYKEKTVERMEYLQGALNYFNIKRDYRANMYALIVPTRSEYSEWEMLCFKHDDNVKEGVSWKLCIRCNKYFPYTPDYFKGYTKKTLSHECMLCQGFEFRSSCHDLQILKEENHLELLPLIDEEKTLELYKAIERHGYSFELYYFRDKRKLTKILKHLEKMRNASGSGGFYMSKIAHTINMSTTRFKNILNGSYDIGVKGPLPQHWPNYYPEPKTSKELKMRETALERHERLKKKRRKQNTEHNKEVLRKKTKDAWDTEVKNLISWCRETFPNQVAISTLSNEVPSALCAFLTPEGLHIIVKKAPDIKTKYLIHVVPQKPFYIKNLKNELQKVKEEYDRNKRG